MSFGAFFSDPPAVPDPVWYARSVLTALLALLVIGVPVGFAAMGAVAVVWHLKRRGRIQSGRSVLKQAAKRLGLVRTSPWYAKRLSYAGAIRGLEASVELDDGILLRARLRLAASPQRTVSTVFTKEGPASTDHVAATAFIPGALVESIRQAGVRLEVGSSESSSEGWVTLDLAAPELGEGSLERALPALAEVGARAVLESPLEALLENNVREDPSLAVRERSLSVLMATHAGAEETKRALSSAAASGEPALKLMVAESSDDSEVAREMLKDVVTHPRLDADVRDHAFVVLLRGFKEAPTRRLLLDSFELASGWVQASILLELVAGYLATGAESSIETSARELRHYAPLVKPAGIATLIESFGKIGAEPDVLSYLDHDDLAARVAAARSLAQYGSPASIEALKARVGRLSAGRLREAASMAIDRIKERHALPGAEPGLLTLSGGEARAGGLTVSEEAGKLSASESGLSSPDQ
ncbi:MAG: HEAT repeat domain-containing protein [Deltaproteobacteria bacterium]|nr:HEAT repeat domain-containing protein [Deltaproteobacteria bacterium]